MNDEETRRYKAKMIDRMYSDPVQRREAHAYQNRLNEFLESAPYEERVAVLVDLMKENTETLDELIKEIKGGL